VRPANARAYDGVGSIALPARAGAVRGPEFYVRLSESAWIAAGWNIQVAGHAVGAPGALDLANFERHEVKVRFGQAF
jgi:hypothetical protein